MDFAIALHQIEEALQSGARLIFCAAPGCSCFELRHSAYLVQGRTLLELAQQLQAAIERGQIVGVQVVTKVVEMVRAARRPEDVLATLMLELRLGAELVWCPTAHHGYELSVQKPQIRVVRALTLYGVAERV